MERGCDHLLSIVRNYRETGSNGVPLAPTLGIHLLLSLVGEGTTHPKATEGANREGHEEPRGWRIVGRMQKRAQGPGEGMVILVRVRSRSLVVTSFE